MADADDILGLLSEGGDMLGSEAAADEVTDVRVPCEATASRKSTYQSKVGIGVLGPPVDEAEAYFQTAWDKLKTKVCAFCKKALIDPDPVNPSLVRAWHKPRHQGRVCAYCGVARIKLYPTMNVEAAIQLVHTRQDEFNRFHSFLENMIAAYKNGDKSARNLHDNQHQQLDKVSAFTFEAATKGKMVLRSAYEGDPEADGRRVVRARWKDGTIQDVVLVPYTKATEMECEWKNTVGHEHRTQVHNGDMLDDPAQLQRLYAELRDSKGKSQFTGKDEQDSLPSKPGRQSRAAAEPSTTTAISIAGDDEPEDADADEDMMDLLMDGGEQKKRPRCGSTLGGVASGSGCGVGRGAGPKAKWARTGGRGGGAAPPPLGGTAGARAGVTRKAASAAKEPEASISGPAADKATSAQLVKMEKIISDFDVAQRASILALDKKYFKECKRLTDVVNAKFLTASRELRPRIGLTTKTLDIIVRYVRAYKQWVRKADDNEFLLEHNSLQKFCMEDPVVNLDFPQCIGYDMQEMMFGNGLMECLENKRHEEMKKRFEYITLPGLLRYKAKDEVESSQTELVNSAILKIIGSSLQTDADVAAAISRMQVFLEPVLHHDLEFASPLFFDLSMLQYVFKNDDNYEGRTKEMADRFRTIANSSSETCKIFTAMGSGRKVIQALKNKVADQIRKETGWQRLSVLASEQTHTLDKLTKMDFELHRVGFQAPDNILQAFRQNLFVCLKEACATIRLVVLSIIKPAESGGAGVTYVDGTPTQFPDLQKDIKVFESLRYWESNQDRVEVNTLSFVKALLKAPLEVMQPKTVDISMAALEVIAPLLADVRSLFEVQEGDRLKFFGTVGFDRDFLDAFLEAGNHLMAVREAEAVVPKLKSVASLLYQDKYWDLLVESGDVEVAIFVPDAEVDNLCAAGEKNKQDIQKNDSFVADSSTLLSALGKGVVATVLMLQWRVHVARLSYAALKKHVWTSLGADFSEITADAQTSFSYLVKHTQQLQAVAQTHNLQQTLERFAAFSEAKVLKVIPFRRMHLELTTAILRCTELLEEVVGRIATQVLAMSNHMENTIPDYEPYTVTEFKTEVVKKELIDTAWEHLATSWVQLHKLHVAAKSLPTGDIIGKFETAHSGTSTTCDRALAACKKFIAVVSTVKLILVVLPKAVKSQRRGIIANQIAKTQGSGLPKNLVDYLVREQTKANSGK